MIKTDTVDNPYKILYEEKCIECDNYKAQLEKVSRELKSYSENLWKENI